MYIQRIRLLKYYCVVSSNCTLSYNSLLFLTRFSMSLDGVNLTHDSSLLTHSADNKAPFTVSVFNLHLIFVLNKLILLNTLSHSERAKSASSKKLLSLWKIFTQNSSACIVSLMFSSFLNAGRILHWIIVWWDNCWESYYERVQEGVTFLKELERAFSGVKQFNLKITVSLKSYLFFISTHAATKKFL